ncbi:MAG: hypothetical protein RL095_189 [Verrucomicrobiota bacterium]|jgi:Cu+-exporting ATPase
MPELVLEEKILACRHCGGPCSMEPLLKDSLPFCCSGCVSVYTLLQENGLGDYYKLAESPGSRQGPSQEGRWAFLDDEALAKRLLRFRQDDRALATLRLPQIHCISCVWLVENLGRLQPGILSSRVNYAKGEADILFDPGRTGLRQIAESLERIGYAPDFRLSDGDAEPARRRDSRLPLIRLVVAGFCFANAMLFSFPAYFGLESEDGLAKLFGGLNLMLTLPVFFFSAHDWWRACWQFLRNRSMSLDFPVFFALAALFVQTWWEILSGRGEGYADSLCGLVFLMLSGRWFQRLAARRLAFDNDYRSFFPLWSTVEKEGQSQTLPCDRLKSGDLVLLRQGELLPVDGRVRDGEGALDYSFVTGESRPVPVRPGERVFAGARAVGGMLKVEAASDIDASYLAGLWKDSVFRESRDFSTLELGRKAGWAFTFGVFLVAGLAALWWALAAGAATAMTVFNCVLVVACPCALALGSSLSLGFAARRAARDGLFLKDAASLERLARIDCVALDKTGTLSDSSACRCSWEGEALGAELLAVLSAAVRQSLHPAARAIAAFLPSGLESPRLSDFAETPGQGLRAQSPAGLIELGSAEFCGLPRGEGSFLRLDGRLLGRFRFDPAWRPGLAQMAHGLQECRVELLSGDSEQDAAELRQILPAATMRFRQQPQDKLRAVGDLRARDYRILFVGDGLNDAGALRAADVGLAVAGAESTFCPACDGVLLGSSLPRLHRHLRFARLALGLVWAVLGLSLLYNCVGIWLAASAQLTPLKAAVLMPISAASMFLLSFCGSRLIGWLAYR